MINKLNFSEEILSQLDEATRKAIEEGRICPIEINLNLSSESEVKIPKNKG